MTLCANVAGARYLLRALLAPLVPLVLLHACQGTIDKALLANAVLDLPILIQVFFHFINPQ